MKVIVLTLLASTFATLAIINDGITHRPFVRGNERRGVPTLTRTFFGNNWRMGDETAFAGIAFDDDGVRFVTGP